MSRFILSTADVGNGIAPADGAKLFFFITGSTTTKKSTFSNEALTTANSNPVIADADGVFPDIWQEGGKYKVLLKDKNDVLQRTFDPVIGTVVGTGSVLSFAVLADAVASLELSDGDAVDIVERTAGNGGGAKWDVVLSSTVTENAANIVQCTGVATLSLVIRPSEKIEDYPTLTSAIASLNLTDGDSLSVEERTTGNGGGATWDVVLSSSVTENTFNIVQCTGVGTLSLVLRDITPVSLPTLGAFGVDDNALLQAGFDTGAKIVDIGGSGALALSTTRTHPANVTLTSSGATITVSGNTTILNLSQESKVKNIKWTGSGIASGNTLELPVRISGVGLCEVTGNTFTSIGGTATLIRQYYTEHDGSRITDNTYTFNNIGINLEERGEYVIVADNAINNNTTGIIVQGGNSRVINNTITDNVTGILVEVGTNDAHGNIDSNSINHNTTNIKINAINVEEMSFVGNSIYVGKITLNGCKGVTFTGGLIESTVLIEEKGAEECEFRTVKFPGGINNTPNDGTESKVLYKDCVIDRSIATTSSISMNGSYSEVRRNGGTTLANATSTTSVFNSQLFNSITSNVSFTVEQLYSTGTFIWSPTLAVVERGFTIRIDLQLSISRTGADPDIGNIHGLIVDSLNNNIIYGVCAKSGKLVLGGDVRTHTLAFCGTLPRKNFMFKLVNDSAATITILSDQTDARSKVEVVGW